MAPGILALSMVLSAAPVRGATGASTSAGRAPVVQDSLPRPTGPRPVVTYRLVAADSSRQESMTDAPGDRRRLVLRIWRPADSSIAAELPRAPYVFGLSRLTGFLSPGQVDAYRSVTVHARSGDVSGPPAGPSGDSLPLVLLSPALGGLVAEYTSIAEDLASHGFVVVGIHPLHDGGPVAVPGGDVVPLHSDWREHQPEEVGPERYFDFSRRRVEVLARDASFVLDWLASRQEEPRAGPAPGTRPRRVGYLGHSVGGKAAVLACRTDERIGACANLDGWPMPGRVEVAGIGVPFLYVEESRPSRSDAWLERTGVTRQQYDMGMAILDIRKALLMLRSDADAFHARLAGARHHSFSDRYLVRPSSAPPELEAAPHHTVRVIRRLLRRFFGRYLQPGTAGGGLSGDDLSASTGGAGGRPELELRAYRGTSRIPGRSCTPRDPSAVERLDSQMRAVGALRELWAALSSTTGGSATAVLSVADEVVWRESAGEGGGTDEEAGERGSGGGWVRGSDPATGIEVAVRSRDPGSAGELQRLARSGAGAIGRALSFCPEGSGQAQVPGQ